MPAKKKKKNPSTNCLLQVTLPRVQVEGMTTYPDKTTHQTIKRAVVTLKTLRCQTSRRYKQPTGSSWWAFLPRLNEAWYTTFVFHLPLLCGKPADICLGKKKQMSVGFIRCKKFCKASGVAVLIVWKSLIILQKALIPPVQNTLSERHMRRQTLREYMI